MTTGIVIQARMGSQRLPAKVLCELCGAPMLQYMLESLGHCEQPVAEVVIATSETATDDPIAAFCESRNLSCWRGSLADVASRFRDLVADRGWQHFVRLSGDSPLLDFRIVDRAILAASQTDCDLVTNVLPRTFPRGQSVEVLHGATFVRAYERMSDPDDFEHVTRLYYSHPGHYSIERIEHTEDRSDVHLAVDTATDLEVVRDILTCMDRPHWTYPLPEIVQLYTDIARRRRAT